MIPITISNSLAGLYSCCLSNVDIYGQADTGFCARAEDLGDQVWWYTHLTLQYLTGILTLIALWLIWDMSGTRDGAFLHHLMGWTTVVLCVRNVWPGAARH